jgi:geranylgeranyl transferase type-1 subunit beta
MLIMLFFNALLCSIGGTTYIALASLYLAPSSTENDPLTPEEKAQTIRWLLNNQTASGGFSGRTGKTADSCYCFWCGAALKVCLKLVHSPSPKML